MIMAQADVDLIGADKKPLTPAAPAMQTGGDDKSFLQSLYSDAEQMKEQALASGKKLDEMQARMPDIKPVPPPTVQTTNPREIWASAAMSLAAISGFFTRQHLTTALNSAAQVFKAYREGDQQAANQAYESWKIASQNAQEMAKFEYEQLRDARLEHKDDDNAYLASVKAIAAETHNQALEQAANTHNVLLAERIAEEARRTDALIGLATEKMDEHKILDDAWKDLQTDPKFASLSPFEKARLYYQMQSKHAPSSDTRGDGSKQDQAQAYQFWKAVYVRPDDQSVKPHAPQFADFYKNIWPDWESYNFDAKTGATTKSEAPPPAKPGPSGSKAVKQGVDKTTGQPHLQDLQQPLKVGAQGLPEVTVDKATGKPDMKEFEKVPYDSDFWYDGIKYHKPKKPG
jgi:hypothetical protein